MCLIALFILETNALISDINCWYRVYSMNRSRSTYSRTQNKCFVPKYSFWFNPSSLCSPHSYKPRRKRLKTAHAVFKARLHWMHPLLLLWSSCRQWTIKTWNRRPSYWQLSIRNLLKRCRHCRQRRCQQKQPLA